MTDLLPLESTLPEDVKRYVRASKANSTKKAYRNCLEHFIKWGGSIPATSEMVAAYLSAHANCYSVATLELRLVAISQTHKLKGLPNPVETELVRHTFSGIKRVHGTQQNKSRAAVLDVILRVVEMLDVEIDQDSLLAMRDKALILIMFAGGLRRSEVAPLCLHDDLEMVDEGIVVTLNRSKSDQEGKGELVAIPYAREHLQACPVQALSGWIGPASIVDGPVFRAVNRHGQIVKKIQNNEPCGISGTSVNLIIKSRIEQAGIPEAEKYSSHSMRAGMTTSSIIGGRTPLPVVAKHLRHKDVKTTMEYVRVHDLFANNAASFL